MSEREITRIPFVELCCYDLDDIRRDIIAELEALESGADAANTDDAPAQCAAPAEAVLA